MGVSAYVQIVNEANAADSTIISINHVNANARKTVIATNPTFDPSGVVVRPSIETG